MLEFLAQTHRGCPLAMSVYPKSRAKETNFRRQKNRLEKKLSGSSNLPKSFLLCIFMKLLTLTFSQIRENRPFCCYCNLNTDLNAAE